MSNGIRSLACAAALALASDATAAVGKVELDPHFAPIAFLVGHCWRARFSDTMQDEQCFASMYGGKLVHNTHRVLGTDPLYEGTTWFSWDAKHERVRFHYFTSTGAVSEGHLVASDDGYSIPERHVDDTGAVIEMESAFTRDGETGYRVVVRQKAADGQWSQVADRSYVRVEATDAAATSAKETPRSQLVWNSNRHGDWDVIGLGANGEGERLTPAGSNEWGWSARGSELLLLSTAKSEIEAKGWRAARLAAIGSAPQRISDAVVADGFVDCHPRRDECVAEIRDGERKRIARLTATGEATPIDLGPGNAADPQWSPDGEWLLFRSDRGGSWELWLARGDGSEARALTVDPANDDVPAHAYGGEGPARFSPDGAQVVWMRKFPDREFDVWRMRLDGSDARNLTADHAGADGYPSWSPDGDHIAFDSDRDGDSEIYRMRADGSEVERITLDTGSDLAPIWVERR